MVGQGTLWGSYWWVALYIQVDFLIYKISGGVYIFNFAESGPVPLPPPMRTINIVRQSVYLVSKPRNNDTYVWGIVWGKANSLSIEVLSIMYAH